MPQLDITFFSGYIFAFVVGLFILISNYTYFVILFCVLHTYTPLLFQAFGIFFLGSVLIYQSSLNKARRLFPNVIFI
jgi:hypothetical protein